MSLNGLLLSSANTKTQKLDGIKSNNPQSAYSGVVNYLSYADVYASASSGDHITWSFTGSNTNVGIYAMAMDSTNFAHFSAHTAYSFYRLSDGSYTGIRVHFIRLTLQHGISSFITMTPWRNQLP
jgi:hypothetical protein